jgi:chromatin segregation and condensation protein Rec8/ScpA/Scc1 (kleisin family)
MDTLSMDKASEFLEMAAMLVYIKSRMILPANEYDEDMEDDPELDLISRLKEYKTFKDASATLKEYEGGARKAFFKLPEEKVTVPGQYWLSVDFAGSQVQVPFRIMTKEERKYFRKNSEDLKKGYKAFLKQESEKAKRQG